MNTKEIIEALNDFKYSAKPSDFDRIFGPSVGDHLWSEFVKFNHDPLKLYASMSGDNRDVFIQQIEEMAKAVKVQ